jgi:dipeptidyl aminopeptidase/acylaminoacyl peptidase
MKTAKGESPRDINFHAADGTVVHGCVRKPLGKGPFPAVIFIHGGFGNNREYTRELLRWSIAESLWREGFVVFSTDYRIDYQGKDIDDIVAAFKYVSELSFVDKDKIIYFGDSHGSYLAMMAALKTNPLAIVHCWGVVSFVEWYDHIRKSDASANQQIVRMLEESFGGTPDQVPEAYRQASVLAHVDALECPVLIIHGGEDNEVPVSQAYKLAESLERAKHEFKLKVFKNEGHGIRNPQARQEMDEIVLGFLKKRLG